MKACWRLIIGCIGLWALAGCMPHSYARSNKDIHAVAQEIAQTPEALSIPVVRMDPGYYVDTRPMRAKAPDWLSHPVKVHAQDMPLASMLQQLLRHEKGVLHFQEGVHREHLVSLQYVGDLRGALDRLAAQTHNSYAVTPEGLTWQALQTRTFNIAFMPGTSDYLIGQTGNARQQDADHEGGANQIVKTRGHLYDAQYSNLQASLSVWKDLKSVLNELKSKAGQVIVSEATTTVTVRDTPDRVAAMGQYIHDLNQRLARQVNVKIQVLNVELNDSSNYGINWDMVQRVAGTKLRIVGALADATNLATTRVASTAASAGLTTFSLGSGTTPKAVINALSEQGEVSVVTQPEVTTMSNQIAEVLITRDTGYLQSVSSTTITNEGTTTSLTPGVVTDGFSLYLLPKIHGQDVYLQISSTLSTLTQLVSVSNAATGGSSSIVQSIQVPTMSEKHFNQRTRVRSGDTLVITGFKQTQHQTKKVAPFGATAVGAASGESKNMQTLVLITPVIIEQGD